MTAYESRILRQSTGPSMQKWSGKEVQGLTYSSPEAGHLSETSALSSPTWLIKRLMKWATPRRIIGKYRVQTQPIVKLKIQAALRIVVQGYRVQTQLVEKSKIQAAPRIVIQRYAVQNQLIVQRRGVAAELEIIARDTMDASDDSLGNDLKGVSGVLTRTR